MTRDKITKKQIALIEIMNMWCDEKFDLENNKSKKAANEYIARNRVFYFKKVEE